ncbi:hypothetical protein [Mycobacteroides saopaulense]|uniref:TIGR04197 family type VII secretion effector n=1 Tax=Mycobacteroides saopaulense TaxID=1578165 RepID=A0ABX3BXK4_9MYCO|nr:hypothetical protein [Mycobacteroides saopaulense]OHT86650.1 hypothetical protein BKG68_10980 [Mycobacteroides saopaulense]OHU08508.1 hypothetical protein BKG73_15670 [Mycobacteroides saopaulense]
MSLDNLTNSANADGLVLHIDTNQFRDILTACDVYADGLQKLKNQAITLSGRKLGFSEEHLDSGSALARKFQAKAAGEANSAENTFQSHIDRVEEMKTLFVALRNAYERTEHSNTRAFGGPSQ